MSIKCINDEIGSLELTLIVTLLDHSNASKIAEKKEKVK
jgi:hypothetical protein